MKKAIVFLADGCEMVEALTPVDLLRRAGVEVVTVSIHDRETIISSHHVEIRADRVFDEHIAEDADIVILPGGGQGTVNLGNHSGVKRIVQNSYENGKYIAAICAAPSIFAKLGLLQGKKAISYPSFEEQLTGAQLVRKEVVVDGSIITSRGMGTAIPFSLVLIRELLGEETAVRIQKEIIFKEGESY